MESGFSNFQKIYKGQKLAISEGLSIFAERDTTLFMPLYQPQGDDGYFLIRKIPKFFLWLSAAVRWFRIDLLFPILPGVRWASEEKEEMKVDLRIARLIAKQIFHLFGYRSRRHGEKHLLVTSREHKSKYREYVSENWYKS